MDSQDSVNVNSAKVIALGSPEILSLKTQIFKLSKITLPSKLNHASPYVHIKNILVVQLTQKKNTIKKCSVNEMLHCMRYAMQ
jgi:hypothetical protein